MRRRLIGFFAAILLASFALAGDGYFACTQYTFNAHPESLSDASSFINSHTTRKTTKHYSTIAFQDLDPGIVDGRARFKTVSFPGNGASKDLWFGMTATGWFEVPESGLWTLACGSDDGFRIRIEGNGFSGSFEYGSIRLFDVTLHTFNFPVAGVYSLDLLYYEQGGYANCELSMAKGSHSSFSTSTFSLIKAASEPSPALTLNNLRSDYHKISLSWTPSYCVGPYVIYRGKTLAELEDATTRTRVASVSGTTYTDTTVEKGCAYYYQIVASDGTESNEQKGISLFKLDATDNLYNRVKLSWTGERNLNDWYYVFRSENKSNLEVCDVDFIFYV